jgi:hypothetical protein
MSISAKPVTSISSFGRRWQRRKKALRPYAQPAAPPIAARPWGVLPSEAGAAVGHRPAAAAGQASAERDEGLMQDGSAAAVVRFFALPLAACAPERSWRHAAEFLSQRLNERFGEKVQCEFVELLSPESFQYSDVLELLKQSSQPPFVTVNGRLIQKGGKFSERLIKEELERVGIRRNS